MITKNLYCIMGQSGVGKTTLADELSKELGMQQVSSYTTRKPRFRGEIGHVFVSNDEFTKLGKLCAYTERNGAKYGITAKLLDECQLYVIDPAGLKLLRKNYTTRPIKVIGLTAPTDELKRRMLSRGDSEATVNERLKLDSDSISTDELLENCDILIPARTVEQTLATAKGFIMSCENRISIKTRGGELIAEPNNDTSEGCYGMWVMYRLNGSYEEHNICYVENTSKECIPYDYNERFYGKWNEKDLRVLVWDDPTTEDYTAESVIHNVDLAEIDIGLVTPDPKEESRL